MKAVNLADYDVEIAAGKTEPYKVRNSLISVLFAPHQQLSGRALLDRDDLARKVRDAKGTDDAPDLVAFEDAEFDKIKAAVETQTGYGKFDVEFVRRILG